MSDHRFPCEQHRYLQSVGKILPRILGKIFLGIGFGVWINPGQANGVDMELFDREGSLVLVAEILNWSPYSMLSDERKQCIIHNLTSYNCARLLVYTAMRNNALLLDLPEYGISVLRIGYQVLTKKSYDFYLARNQVVERKINGRSVKREIRSKVLQYLESVELTRQM